MESRSVKFAPLLEDTVDDAAADAAVDWWGRGVGEAAPTDDAAWCCASWLWRLLMYSAKSGHSKDIGR